MQKLVVFDVTGFKYMIVQEPLSGEGGVGYALVQVARINNNRRAACKNHVSDFLGRFFVLPLNELNFCM